MKQRVAVLCLLLSVPLLLGAQDFEKLAPFVPTPPEVVERMLKLAGVKAGDTVFDLGCGDGRIVIMAAQKFGAKGVGVEMDDELYTKTVARVKELGLQDKVKIIKGDLMQADITSATVVTLYLLPSSNEKLRPKLEKSLKPGSRVVSHDFEMPGWKTAKTEEMETEDIGRMHTLYLYKVGENK
jgi:cyclopropane fatty-acyl-phospholipid synthase-like methyltransferase